jgi:membrane protein
MSGRNFWGAIKETFSEFSEDEVTSRAAGLAFYTALGLAPTVMLFLTVAAWLGEGTQDALIGQIESMVGGEAAKGIDMVVESAEEKPRSGALSAVIGIVTVLFSASGIFAQLQSTLNRIWDVQVRPGAGWWIWVRSRILSMGMVLAVLFLLLVSLVVSAATGLLFSGTGAISHALNVAVSTVVYVVLFAMIFKYLPDVQITWRDVWIGAGLTAILFAVGKYAIGLYVGNSALASSYGAAGSLVALLVWVYYSAVVVFFGAEVTQVIAGRFGSGIKPAKHAVREEEAKTARMAVSGAHSR